MTEKLIIEGKEVVYKKKQGILDSFTWKKIVVKIDNKEIDCHLEDFLNKSLRYVKYDDQIRIDEAIADARIAVPKTTSAVISPFTPHQSSIFEILETKELRSGYAYGNRTDIVLTMAYIIGKDFSAGSLNFSGHTNNFTKEGYTLWELLASNLNGDAKDGWTNIIDEHSFDIKEISDDKEDPIGKDVKRLVFARNEKGEHVFLGVYRFKGYDPSNPKIAIYEKIDSFYNFW